MIMNRNGHLHRAVVGCLLAAIGTAAPGYAQADFFEGFNALSNPLAGEQGPPELIDDGWIFVNHSNPVGPWAWEPGSYMPFEGSAHLESTPLATDFGGTVSAWAILPEIPNLQSGDIVSFYVRSSHGESSGQTLELRYSPSGGTNVGSGFFDTGDFTEALLVLDPPPLDPEFWSLVTVTVPGSGRLALWHH